ncbi:alpha-hydroxy-acid oxidizing protein [Tardiphaga sp. 172_B4_N1_3]|uniref:alpha-hydroxy-acid oxidizing protein n=1 Tax=Tardiphaga sp. 172_B4_N1_3 TaxID=3240787 RepID=UPI003F8B8194
MPPFRRRCVPNTGFSETQAGFAGGVFFLAYAVGSLIFAGVHVEMIAAGKVLIFNILNEANKSLPASGVSGAVLLTSGNDRETLPLVTSGTALKAEAKGDIVKGASVTVTLKTAVGIGRQYVWGLASFGEAGVDRVLQILDDEFITIMRQVGALDINHITRRCVTSA